MLAGCAYHEHPEPGPRDFRLEGLKDRKWVVDVGPAPPGAGFGHLKISAGRRTASLDPDACFRDAEEFPRLMFGKHAGDVVVDHYDLVDLPEPLLGEHSDGRRPATHPHPLFPNAINDGRLARLHDHRGAILHAQLDGSPIAKLQQGVAGDGAFPAAAPGEMPHAAEG